MRLIGVCLALAGLHQQVLATTLPELLNKARTSDPAYLSARANFDMALAKREQAFGALLPQLSFSASKNQNVRDYKTRDSLIPTANDEYDSDSATVNFTQALFRPANVYGFKQSNNVLLQAEKELQFAEQTLLLNLAVAWFDWLAAIDAEWLADRKLAFASRELNLLVRGHELGSFSQIELEEAQAKHGQAEAEREVAQVEVLLKKAELERLVGDFESGSFVPSLNKMAADPVQPEQTLAQVLKELETANPQFLAAQQAVFAASQEIRKQNSGHAPTLDWVITHGKNSQGVGGFPGQAGYDITTTSSGLQFNLPLFTGGTQQGKVKEAIAQRDKASAELSGALRQVKLGAKQAWYGLVSARARGKASRQSRLAASNAYIQAQRAFELGLESELAVLKAEQEMVAAENDFNKSKYDQWVAWIRLKASAGALGESDVAMLHQLMIYPAKQLQTNELGQ
jgi:outer membrane protein